MIQRAIVAAVLMSLAATAQAASAFPETSAAAEAGALVAGTAGNIVFDGDSLSRLASPGQTVMGNATASHASGLAPSRTATAQAARTTPSNPSAQTSSRQEDGLHLPKLKTAENMFNGFGIGGALGMIAGFAIAGPAGLGAGMASGGLLGAAVGFLLS